MNEEQFLQAIRDKLDQVSFTNPRWDGEGSKVVEAECAFFGGAGLEDQAALAWAFEMDVRYGRGVGEAPVVRYEPFPADEANLCPCDGTYYVRGPITTNHPGDVDMMLVEFDKGEPWCLRSCSDRARKYRLLSQAGRIDEAERWDVTPSGSLPE